MCPSNLPLEQGNVINHTCFRTTTGIKGIDDLPEDTRKSVVALGSLYGSLNQDRNFNHKTFP